jgi:hypothetical protein
MKQISQSEALGKIAARVDRGHHIDDRLIREVHAPGEIHLFAIQSQTDFLRLIWQASDSTRLLTPFGAPRTLGHVAARMVNNGWTFSSLCHLIGLPESVHNPRAFEKFKMIDEAFDSGEFGFLGLTPAVPSEQRESPTGTYYLYDGVHRSIVLAYRVLIGKSPYFPVECLLLSPRRY